MTNRIRGRKALIVGGGIAGTVAAIALRKAGEEPVMVEAFEKSADGIGAFLTIAPNGVRGLRALGVDDACLAEGFDTPRFSLALGNGRSLAEMSAGAGTKTIRRGDLYRSLRREAETRGVRVEYGKRLNRAERDGDGVVAHFEDGSALEADYLIGADGLHSRVRTIVDPAAPEPRFLGLLNTGGFAQNRGLSGEPGTVHMIFGKRCFFGWTQHPAGEVWWFANPSRAIEPTRAELVATPADAWRRELTALLAVDASPAAAIVEATENIIGPWPTHDIARVPIWHRDRMLIIGDAAHAASPSSGQGASMAIEDAIVLAKSLRDAPDVGRAFSAFERLRRGRVERVVAIGRRNGSGKTPGPFGRAFRDLALRVIFSRASSKDPMAWIHEQPIDWDSAVRVDGASP